jgi:hypothetical protein
MGRDSAKTFADRLPEVVPKREEDISHLSDEMADLLYPGRRPRPFRMGVVFDNFGGPNYPRALEIARRSSVYREIGSGASMRHQAEFDATEARTLRDLYNIVGEIHTTEVLVEGRRVPYAREIWLPLYWIFVNGEASA